MNYRSHSHASLFPPSCQETNGACHCRSCPSDQGQTVGVTKFFFGHLENLKITVLNVKKQTAINYNDINFIKGQKKLLV